MENSIPFFCWIVFIICIIICIEDILSTLLLTNFLLLPNLSYYKQFYKNIFTHVSLGAWARVSMDFVSRSARSGRRIYPYSVSLNTSKLLPKKVTPIHMPMRVCFPSPFAAFDILQLLNICQLDKYKTYIYILTKFSMTFPSHPYLFSYSKSQVVLCSDSLRKGCDSWKQEGCGGGRSVSFWLLSFKIVGYRIMWHRIHGTEKTFERKTSWKREKDRAFSLAQPLWTMMAELVKESVRRKERKVLMDCKPESWQAEAGSIDRGSGPGLRATGSGRDCGLLDAGCLPVTFLNYSWVLPCGCLA